MERFVVATTDLRQESRKPSRRSTAPGLAALLDRRPAVSSRGDAARAGRGSLRLPRGLRRPGGTERRSPFQSARTPTGPPAVPGGLKGRGRLREARRHKHASKASARSEPRDRSRPRAFEVVKDLFHPKTPGRPTSYARLPLSQFTGVQVKSIPCEYFYDTLS